MGFPLTPRSMPWIMDDLELLVKFSWNFAIFLVFRRQ